MFINLLHLVWQKIDHFVQVVLTYTKSLTMSKSLINSVMQIFLSYAVYGKIEFVFNPLDINQVTKGLAFLMYWRLLLRQGLGLELWTNHVHKIRGGCPLFLN